jgi:hypothetical protein
VRRSVIVAITAAAIGVGAAGAAVFLPAVANAGGRLAQVTASPSGPAAPGYGRPGDPGADGHGPDGHGPGGPGGIGRHELVSDESVVATAIGISEADLTAALATGQTVAQVAKAHGVNPQKVIDALVADGKSELADLVKTGKITQAQADAAQADAVRRATDQVNGTHGFGGPGGPGGPGDPGRPNDNDADDVSPSPSAS